MKCQRCGSPDVSWNNDIIGLFGGVQATLCNTCATEWTGALSASPIWDRQVELDARAAYYQSLAIAQRPVDEAVQLRFHRDLEASKRAAFEFGLEFVRPIKVAAARRDDD